MRHPFSQLFLFLFISIVFYACSSVRQMEVHVPKPTLVTLPSEVKRLVLVDKSQGNAVTAIEGILTGELLGVDKLLAQECLSAITNPFLNYSSVQVTRYPERLKSENASSTGFGAPMPWNQVQAIATANNADALLVLEYFDSDFSIRDVSAPNNVGTVLFQGFAKASAGIRIYLPASQRIFFEKGFTYSKFYGETANNRAALVARLAFGTDALKFAASQVGKRIGNRFVSYRQWEDRVIFKGKGGASQRAERLILAQDYVRAISELESVFRSSTDNKTRAAAAHNLGYCFEIQGDLEESKRWLSESFILSGSKKTQAYLDIINRRIEEQFLIESQRSK